MLVLTCPYCGLAAAETELAPGGAAHIPRAGPESSDAELEAYLFTRSNPRGPHLERWRHRFGCGRWFIAARCTLTQRVFGTYPAQSAAPPEDVLRAISEARDEARATEGPISPEREEQAIALPARGGQAADLREMIAQALPGGQPGAHQRALAAPVDLQRFSSATAARNAGQAAKPEPPEPRPQGMSGATEEGAARAASARSSPTTEPAERKELARQPEASKALTAAAPVPPATELPPRGGEPRGAELREPQARDPQAREGETRVRETRDPEAREGKE